MRAEMHLKSADPPGFREGMLSLFHPHVPMEVIEMFKPGYCGLCCIKFSGDKFCWKHYTGKGHAGLLQRKSYRNPPLPWQKIFHALISKPDGASQPQILRYIHTNYDTRQTPGQLARTVEMTLADMVGRFQNVVFDKYSCLYRLRERNPSDLPNPIPLGCDREERKKRVEKEGGRERRREERLEPEHEWRRRKEREIRENKENLHREQREKNRPRENKENRGDGGQMRRYTSHKREWRESFAIKKNEMEVVDSRGFSNTDISVNGGGQSFRREKRKISSKESMMEQGKVSSPRVENMESSSSRSYTSQERESKNTVRTPDSTPPRPFTLPPFRAMLPRQLTFGPVGSQLKASAHTKTSNCLQQNSPHAFRQEKAATEVALSASYLQQNGPQALPHKQTLQISASYRPQHAFPSADSTGLGFSPSTFPVPSVFQFRSNPDLWRFS